MKLYSKSQLILFTIAGMVLATSVSFYVATKISTRKSESKQSSIEPTDFIFTQENIQQKNNFTAEFHQNVMQATEVNYGESETKYTSEEIQNINVYESCSEAVVNINTQITAYDWYLEPVVKEGGSGSGSIIDTRGYVLTNVHVISGASKIYVALSDGNQFEATVVGTDPESDLAVIKFTPPEGTELHTIPFGDSTKLKVGQKVIAIGNPFGLARTMTTGIISALGRPIQSGNYIIKNMIQTDTAINPGNSGGPLLDTNGRMIGINTMIYSSTGSYAGIGFCVPAETAVRVASDILKYGKVKRGILQIETVQLTRRISSYARLDITQGLLVSKVTSGGNADVAGIMGGTEAVRYGRNIIYLGGDIITQIDNIPVASLADYYLALESKRPGDMVNVKLHRNGQDRVVQVRLTGTDIQNANIKSSTL